MTLVSNTFYFLLSLLYLLIALAGGAHFFAGRPRFLTAVKALLPPALLLHAFSLVFLGLAERRVPIANPFEALSILAFFLAVLFVLLRALRAVEVPGVFVFPLAFAFQAIAAIGPRVVDLSPGLVHSAFFGFHTVATLLGYGAFVFSMSLGLMYLQLFRELKIRRPRLMFDRLPPLELLERMNGISLAAGFAFLTLGLASGLRMAFGAWERLPFLDVKVLLSVVLWLLYLFGLVMKGFFRWNGRKLSYLSVAGFFLLVFTFAATRLMLPTAHDF